MGKRITMKKVPWDYKWPNVTAYTHFTELGDFTVKDEVAEAAIKAGVAVMAKDKPKRATAAAKPANRRSRATRTTTDARSTGNVGRTGVLPDGGAVAIDPVAPAE